MNSNTWPKRFFALNVSRGIATLAVVMWHWQHFGSISNSLSKNFNRAGEPLYAIFKIFYEKGFTAVEYFFILSGFTFFWLYRTPIENKHLSFGEFWLKRFSRLWPLHFLTLLIVALLQHVYILHNGNSFVYPFNDIYHFILNLGFASKWGLERGWSFNAPVWVVSIEILLYFVFFAVAYFRQGGVFFCLGTSILSFAVALFAHHVFFTGLALFFLGGAVFHLTFLISAKLHKAKLFVYFVAALSWVLIILDFYVFKFSDFIFEIGITGKVFLTGFRYYIFYPFTVCGLALIEIDKNHFLKELSWIGDITYSSYLLHFPLQLVFGLFVSYGMLNHEFYLNLVYFVIYFLILIPLSYITFIGFERPIQNIIRNQYRLRKNAEQGSAPVKI